MPSDADLARTSSRGDRRAFGELIARCAPMVCAVAYAATRDRELAEDIAQDTFLAAWRDLGSLRDPAAVRPWLCRIARNVAHKVRRGRAHEHVTGDVEAIAEHTPFDQMHAADVERVVAAALATVPDPYREALVLFYYEQRSAKQVAAALGVTEGVVHKRISRGRQFLAAGLDELACRAFARPPRRDLRMRVLAVLPLRPSSKGSVMWKLALAAATTALFAGSSRATPSHAAPAAARTPVRVPRAAPAAVSSPPRLPDSACGAVANHLVEIVHVDPATVTPERIALTTDRLAALCERLAWSAPERTCLLAAADTPAAAACRRAAETHPVSRDVQPVPAIHTTACPDVGMHAADLAIAEFDGTWQDNILVSLTTDRATLRRETLESCEDWSEAQRRCLGSATTMKDVVICNIQSEDDL